MKKGSSLIGDIIAFLFLIVTGYFLTGVIIFANGVAVAEQSLTSDNLEYDLTITAGFFPVRNEVALLSLLECEYTIEDTEIRIPIKKIITECLIQSTKDPYIYGEEIDAGDAVEEVMGGLNPSGTIILRLKKDTGAVVNILGDMDRITEQTQEAVIFQKVTTRVFSPFQDAMLEMYMFEGESEE